MSAISIERIKTLHEHRMIAGILRQEAVNCRNHAESLMAQANRLDNRATEIDDKVNRLLEALEAEDAGYSS